MVFDNPVVSIIVPVFNNNAGLQRLLRAINEQDFAKEQYEVIVVDNRSNSSPRGIAEAFGALYLEENVHVNSPYSARNRGLEIARGEIIILIDTTCSPVKNWIKEGVRSVREGADLVGGGVTFDISPSSSTAEIYDSLFNINMKESVLKRGVAKTTNLFIRKTVFENIGAFPEGLRSGGDVRWTSEAVKNGFRLVYSADAEAIMLPRGGIPLIRKMFRVAKGHPAVWIETGTVLSNIIKKILLCWVPPNPKELTKRIHERNLHFIKKRFFQLYLLGWVLRIVSGIGHISGFLSKSNNQ